MKANLFKVVHKEYVGDNYVGQVQDVVTYVETIKQARQFKARVVSITPIKATHMPALRPNELSKIFDAIDLHNEEAEKKVTIKLLKRLLTHQLNKLNNK